MSAGGGAPSRWPRATGLLLGALLAFAAPPPAEEVTMFAATSLTDTLEELGRAYAAHGDDRLRFAFGASSDLARQIAAGAPADVFFSADPTRVDELERTGLVLQNARRDVLSNVLVVIVPRASTSSTPAGWSRAARPPPFSPCRGERSRPVARSRTCGRDAS